MLVASLGILLQIAAADTGVRPALREAQAAQASFERFRRGHLPRAVSRSGGECTTRIGRFCYWYDPGDSTVVPEPRRIAAARHALIATLDRAAERARTDDWVAGQRVRYLLEAGRARDARDVARACGLTWWCAALEGLALHVGGARGEADSVYDVALLRMPAAQRCEWHDLRGLVHPRLERELGDTTCARRMAAANRLWSLGQPLWMLRGNDLRTEHFARQTMALVLERARNAHAVSFGDDSRELVMRFGWAEWYTRDDAGIGSYASYSVTGHDREPSFHFFPRAPGLTALNADAWDLPDPLAPSRYAPRHVRRLVGLPHQIGRFPRGDSTLLVAVIPRPDSLLGTGATAALAVFDGTTVRVVDRGDAAVLRGVAANTTLVIGVEAYHPGSRHAARARFTSAPSPCGGTCLSDLLLVDPTAGEARSLAEALDRSRPHSRLRAGEAVGVYFELAALGTRRPERASFELVVEPNRVTTMRRVAAALRLARLPGAVRLRWTGVVEPRDGVAPQYILLRVPAAAPGTYRLQLAVESAGMTLTTWRELTVVR